LRSISRIGEFGAISLSTLQVRSMSRVRFCFVSCVSLGRYLQSWDLKTAARTSIFPNWLVFVSTSTLLLYYLTYACIVPKIFVTTSRRVRALGSNFWYWLSGAAPTRSKAIVLWIAALMHLTATPMMLLWSSDRSTSRCTFLLVGVDPEVGAGELW
jgi:hypothetical protein